MCSIIEYNIYIIIMLTFLIDCSVTYTLIVGLNFYTF